MAGIKINSVFVCLTILSFGINLTSIVCSPQNATNQEEVRNQRIPPTILDSDLVPYQIYTNQLHLLGILKCIASGLPPPTYTWYFYKNGLGIGEEGVEVAVDSYPFQRQSNGTILLTMVLPDNYGTYVCHASNPSGTAVQHPIRLVFAKTSPMKRSPVVPTVIRVLEGAPYQLTCEMPESVPETKIMFTYMYRNRFGNMSPKRLINSTRISVVQDNKQRKGILFFEKVITADEDNQIACLALNDQVGTLTTGDRFQFQVIPNLNDTSFAPQLQYISNYSINTTLGERVDLHCIISNEKVPQIPIWKKDGSRIVEKRRQIFTINRGRSLSFMSAEDADDGDYTCEFHHINSTTRIYEIRLRVFAAPRIPNNMSPSIKRDIECDTDELGLSGTSTCDVINCPAIGKPSPTITFYKDGKELTKEPVEGTKVDNMELIIRHPPNAMHSGFYQCKAENEFGIIWANFYYNVSTIV